MNTDKKTSPEAFQMILETLENFKKEHPVPPKNTLGICNVVFDEARGYLWDLKDEILNALEEAFRAWPKFSGRILFPVPGGGKQYRYDLEHLSLWQDPNRVELMNFIIDYAKKQLGESE